MSRSSKPRRLSPDELIAAVIKFNESHKVGDRVRVWPGTRPGRSEVVVITAPGAYVLGGHSAVVRVTGGHGCIALDHVGAADVGEGGAAS